MLQGTLTDFTLADVFSLLALTKKTGALTVTANGTDGRVFFRDGVICLALSDSRRVPLGARLVSAGLVDAEQVRATVQEHAGDSVAVTEALLASGQVEDRVLGVFLREQVIDAVFELMRLSEGSFSFDAGAPGLSRGVGLSVVEVVGEANRRLDEWQTINSSIASSQSILAMVPSAAGGREGVTLTPEQWELLALIDGRRTVSDVVDLTGRGEFATCRVLGDLVAAGLIQATDPASGERSDLDRLVGAREALRALEDVGRDRINPRLSSAAPLAPGSSQIRWVEPPATKTQDEAPKPGRLQSRTRLADVSAAVVGERAKVAELTGSDKSEGRSEDTPPVVSAPAADSDPDQPADADEPAVADTTDVSDDDSRATSAEEPPSDQPAPAGGEIDRAQVARELASLGADDVRSPAAGDRENVSLTRDADVNKGLLLRLIDGVKGA